MSASSDRETPNGLKTLSGQFPVYHSLSSNDDAISEDSDSEDKDNSENVPLTSLRFQGQDCGHAFESSDSFGYPSDSLNNLQEHHYERHTQPFDGVYKPDYKTDSRSQRERELLAEFRKDSNDNLDHAVSREPKNPAVNVNPSTDVTRRQASQMGVTDQVSSSLSPNINSQELAKHIVTDPVHLQSLSSSRILQSVNPPQNHLYNDEPIPRSDETQTPKARGFPSPACPDLTCDRNDKHGHDLADPGCVDLRLAREKPRDSCDGLNGSVHLPGRVIIAQGDSAAGILSTDTAGADSSADDVIDSNNSILTTKSPTATHPRWDAAITYNEIKNNEPLNFYAVYDSSSPETKSGTKLAHDGNIDFDGENRFLIQGYNSECNEPLLQQKLLVPEPANRDNSYSNQRGHSLSRVLPDLQKTTMGDLYVAENGADTDSVAQTDDTSSNAEIIGVKNGSVGGRRKSDNKAGSNKVDTHDENDDGSGHCGWGRFRFEFCRHFRNSRWFLVVLTICGACQGMAVNGFVNTVISTVERRFEISSTESGLIASCYDIMFVVLVIPISYFGGQGHKPKYLGIGIFVLGIGSFVFALPHFITANYHVENADETVCKFQANTTASCSTDSSTSLSNYKYFFYLGQLLHGAGATPLYTLGVTYLDENVPQRSSAFYNGIFYTGAIIGPAIGYMVGAKFLDIYTDVTVDPSSLGLDPSNPKWVGAWWIGFLISGMLGVLLSLPLLAFPAALPGSKMYALERGQETQASTEVDQTGQHRGLKDILLSLKYLMTNIPFMFINISAAAEGIMVAGFSTFMPKFIEYEFGLPAGTAALYVGLAVVPAGGGATFGGGFIVKCFNLKVRGILRLCTVMSFVMCLLTVALLMECDTSPFAGVTLPYGQTDVGAATFLGKNLDNSCNRNCSCLEEDYFPVCGRDNVMYFSPCYAGCTEVIHQGSVKRYGNCSCVNYNLTTSDYADGSTYMAEFGKCEFSCKWLTLFMVCFGFMIVFVFITSMPSLTATLRCVPDHQRSFGLGIQWIVARCLGSIPGPILFGKMFDFACLLWQKRCSGDGSCFFYDTRKLSLYLLALALAFAIATTASFLLALIFYKVKKEDDEFVLEVSKQSPAPTTRENNSASPDSQPKVILPQNGNIHNDKDYTGTSL